MDEEQMLRKQCLEWAFETRRLREVWHMEVTNVADGYYRWIPALSVKAIKLATRSR